MSCGRKSNGFCRSWNEKGLHTLNVQPLFFVWWAPRESNSAPTDYAYYYSFRCLFPVCSLDCLLSLRPTRTVSTPSNLHIASWLGSGLPRCKQHRLPRIWVVLHVGRVNLPTCNPIAVNHCLRFRLPAFKSAALTKHELEARKTYFQCFSAQKTLGIL